MSSQKMPVLRLDQEPEITKIQINFAGFDELMKLHGVGGGGGL